MNCPRCHHENRPTAKYCEQCAAPLTRNCANCGSPLPDKARFCPECAQPGETLMSHSVYRAVMDLVDAHDLGENAAKGFDAPVRVYRARALRPSRAQRLPFVGRQSELRQLNGLLDGTRESSTSLRSTTRGGPAMPSAKLRR